MKTISRYIMTLALLITAVGGAWAQDPVAKDIVVSPESGTNISDAIKDALGTNGDWALNITINLAKGGTYTITESIVPSASITINGNDATIDASGLTTHFIKMRKNPSYDKVQSGQYIVTTPSKIENVTITGLTRALIYDNGTEYFFKDFTINNCLINYSEQRNLIISFAASMVINFTITNSTFYCKDKNQSSANCIAMSGKRPWQVTGFEDKDGKLLVDHNTFYNVAYTKQFFNTNTLKGQTKYKYEFNSNIFVNVSNKKIYGNLTNNKNQVTTDGLNTYIWDDTFFSETNYNGDEGLKSDPSFKDVENGDFTLDRSSLQYKNNTGDPLWFNPKVTINDNQTTASFEMPTSDVTAEYDLVRDMSYKVAFSGVPTRARLAKDGNGKFHFADGLTFQLLDNIDAANPKDITSAEGITFMVGEMVPFDLEGSTHYQLDKETLVPLADFLADAHLGNYVICAVASTGEYDGSFSSGMITLFQGYEVTVGAGEYATFYAAEALTTEENSGAELYTIASVSDTEAVLSDAIEVAPAETPLLVFNGGEEAKTFLLIPTAEPDLALTVADAFKGTLDAKEFSKDDMEAAVYYVCTGKAFAPVKSAGTIAANRCWLEISTAAPSNARKIVSGNATGIDSMVNGQWSMDNYYDLNGRKVLNPTKKGIYIKNGKKVVIK